MIKLYNLFSDGTKTTIIAEVVEFDDDQMIVKWCIGVRSLVVYEDRDDFKSECLTNGRVLCMTIVSY